MRIWKGGLLNNRFPLETSFFPKKFFRYYKPPFVFIYLLAYNEYPSLDPIYFFEAYIGASRLFNRPPFHIYIYFPYIYILAKQVNSTLRAP